ncbi:carbohydrate ABC transporter permease [Paenibacillus sp. J5C_2022]|uniref:carbohydrate ABC transporter permease n=1 Tax=Paenibacillus sp. J5C2022 TaxID=2977129 RepID=UPI0021D32581|nr:carbohydrate ABC transporter permease [Paenibacillus sp. J5C2022]MCU6708549.1 carbohydrate ABC transporter permease [Paenibacillus sp. J5C2022]
MKPTSGEKLFAVFNYILLALFALAALYPFVYVLSASLSSSEAVVTGSVWLWPIDIQLQSYVKVMQYEGIWTAYANTIYYTVVGTACSLLLTVLGAYPLSKQRLQGGTFISFMIAFTMWFNAGMIPMYLNFRDLGLLDNRAAIIIGFALSAFYVILMRTFFQNIPNDLEESAKVDGANDFQILWKIYLPLSKAALTTIGLFYAVFRWNGYFWAMVLLKDENKIPLQVLLKKLIVELNLSEEMMASRDVTAAISQETVVYATIIISIIPIVAVYPFIQRYFVKGVMIGSVKG